MALSKYASELFLLELFLADREALVPLGQDTDLETLKTIVYSHVQISLEVVKEHIIRTRASLVLEPRDRNVHLNLECSRFILATITQKIEPTYERQERHEERMIKRLGFIKQVEDLFIVKSLLIKSDSGDSLHFGIHGAVFIHCHLTFILLLYDHERRWTCRIFPFKWPNQSSHLPHQPFERAKKNWVRCAAYLKIIIAAITVAPIIANTAKPNSGQELYMMLTVLLNAKLAFVVTPRVLYTDSVLATIAKPIADPMPTVMIARIIPMMAIPPMPFDKLHFASLCKI
jgi:hypothetical protein